MSVERISIGGGIYNRAILMQKTRAVFEKSINKYVQMDQISNQEKIANFIVRPVLGDGLGTVAAATISAENAYNQ